VPRRAVKLESTSRREAVALRAASARQGRVYEDERLHTADLHRLGRSIRMIARKLGRAPSTISRELRRTADPAGGGYHPYATTRTARSLSSCGYLLDEPPDMTPTFLRNQR
jgi:hypothetical protein